jgi:hypothetical protein
MVRPAPLIAWLVGGVHLCARTKRVQELGRAAKCFETNSATAFLGRRLSVLIGVPKEIKVQEYRVGPTPDSVREFTSHGTGSSSNRMQGPAL